jgi:hypothetical protein
MLSTESDAWAEARVERIRNVVTHAMRLESAQCMNQVKGRLLCASRVELHALTITE